MLLLPFQPLLSKITSDNGQSEPMTDAPTAANLSDNSPITAPASTPNDLPAPSHMEQFGQGLASAARDLNPFEAVGNTINAFAPRGTNGESFTDNPHSLLNVLKSALPASIQNIAPLNAASNLLGLGDLSGPDNTSGQNSFTNSLKEKSPFDNMITRDQKDVDTKSASAFTPIGQSMLASAQAKLKNDENSRDLYFSNRQGAGNSTDAQAQDINDKGQAAKALVDQANNTYTDLAVKNPQLIQTAAAELTKQGLLSEGVRRGMPSSDLSSPSSEGAWLKYFSDPKNIYVASMIKGQLNADRQNVVLQANAAERAVTPRFNLTTDANGNYDTTSPNYKNAKILVPTLGLRPGEPAGLPSETDWNARVDALDKGDNSFNNQGLGQQSDLALWTGRAAAATTIGEANGVVEQAPTAFKDAIVHTLNAVHAGWGDAALKNAKKVASDVGNSPALNAPNQADTSSIPPKATALGITAEQWAAVAASKDPRDIAYVAKFK